MDTNLKQVNQKLSQLPQELLNEVDNFIDYLIYKKDIENLRLPDWQKQEVYDRLEDLTNGKEKGSFNELIQFINEKL